MAWLLQEELPASASLLNMPVCCEWGIGKLSGVGVAGLNSCFLILWETVHFLKVVILSVLIHSEVSILQMFPERCSEVCLWWLRANL